MKKRMFLLVLGGCLVISGVIGVVHAQNVGGEDIKVGATVKGAAPGSHVFGAENTHVSGYGLFGKGSQGVRGEGWWAALVGKSDIGRAIYGESKGDKPTLLLVNSGTGSFIEAYTKDTLAPQFLTFSVSNTGALKAKSVEVTHAVVKNSLTSKTLHVATEQGTALLASGIGDDVTAVKIMHMSKKGPGLDLVSTSPLAAAKFINESTTNPGRALYAEGKGSDATVVVKNKGTGGKSRAISALSEGNASTVKILNTHSNGCAIEASGKSTKTIAKFVNNDTTYISDAIVENHALYAESQGKGATVMITNTSPKGTSLKVLGSAPYPTASFINKNTSGAHGTALYANSIKGDAGHFNGNVKVTAGYICTGDPEPKDAHVEAIGKKYAYKENDIASEKDLLAKGDLIVGGSAHIDDDIKVGGVKNAVIKTASYGTRLTYADESTEVFLFDRGRGQLKNGEVTVNLDPIFLQTITITEEYPITVYVTPTGECRGLYVSQTTASSFTVKELCNGKSNVTFDWEVGAKRKGYEEERLAQWMGSNEKTALLTSGK